MPRVYPRAGPYGAVEDGATGLLYDTPVDLARCLGRMADERDLRLRVRTASHAAVGRRRAADPTPRPTARLRWQVGQLALLAEPVDHRPGTMDAGIWLEVVQNNEYRLPPQLAATDAVVDVGAHIGGFGYACLSRGAGRVWAFECEPR